MTTTRPILVMMSYRGGERLARCLDSIERSQHHFSRIILSVTAAHDSDDMRQCEEFQQRNPKAEVICTGRELPTMQHQAFWIDYLQGTQAQPTDWVYWLAYDDEVRTRGIDAIVDETGNWPLRHDTVYFGPWAMRHEQPDHLWDGDPAQALESWTSFPLEGPTRLPVIEWIRQQLIQPTYMQMSGSVCPLRNFIDLRDAKPSKKGPMRIEMATAASPGTRFLEEFAEPISIIYERSNSDRANYGQQARAEDWNLIARLARMTLHHPTALVHAFLGLSKPKGRTRSQRSAAKRGAAEEWRVRELVAPDESGFD